MTIRSTCLHCSAEYSLNIQSSWWTKRKIYHLSIIYNFSDVPSTASSFAAILVRLSMPFAVQTPHQWTVCAACGSPGLTSRFPQLSAALRPSLLDSKSTLQVSLQQRQHQKEKSRSGTGFGHIRTSVDSLERSQFFAATMLHLWVVLCVSFVTGLAALS